MLFMTEFAEPTFEARAVLEMLMPILKYADFAMAMCMHPTSSALTSHSTNLNKVGEARRTEVVRRLHAHNGAVHINNWQQGAAQNEVSALVAID